ncbi:sialidase family protein [Saccharopolyspora sp. CA-218241]|uniref:sialidase family protein n=1 Tax=Saccharopolyspora sp. CA-218241 TaxID=3240027 RepID=UPI003D992CB7
MVSRKFRAAAVAAVFALLTAGVAAAEPPGAADVEKGELLRVGGSSYPRLVRLEHSGAADGRVLASMTTYADRTGFAVIHESRDDGATFRQIGEIRDPAGEDERGMCCSTLYELPRRVGDMPAGTLLWAGTAGIGADAEQRRSSIRVWRSDDHGRTWSFLSTVVEAPVGPGVWEPEFTVTEDGDLAVFYSDDGDPAHDQKLVQSRSSDGIRWSAPRETVTHPDFAVRPGMAGVRRLPDGTYVMVYEFCNYDPVHVCTVWTRTSEDGWDFGPPGALGTEVVSETGTQPLGTPTISTTPDGGLLLGYQMLAHDRGGLAPGNGRTLLHDPDPSTPGGWREIPAPVRISYNQGGTCRNFSPTTLPTADGESVIHVTTDFEHYIGGPCEAFVGVGPIGGADAAGPGVPPHPLDGS